jgi:hypothetical protein
MQHREQTSSPRGGFLRRMLMGASGATDETLKRSHVDLASAVEAAREQAAQGATGTQVEELVTAAVGPVNAAFGRLAESIEGFPHMLVAATDHMSERLDHAHLRLEKRLTSLLGSNGRTVGFAGGSNGTEGSNRARGAVARVTTGGNGTAMPAKIEEDEPLPARPFELEPVEAPQPPRTNQGPIANLREEIWNLPPAGP